MFVQVIEGRSDHREALLTCFARWQHDLLAGAVGYLGSTEGVNDDGRFVILARFANEQSARANAARPEQAAWWTEVEALLDGPATFHESADVTELRHGDVHRAGFVQVMEGRFTDRERAQELEVSSDSVLSAMRPDLLGVTTAYFDDGEYTTVAYFTSEHDARRNESIPMPENLTDQFAEWDEVMPVERYIDLTDPILVRVDA